MLLLMAAALLAGTPNYYMREQLPQVPSVREQTQPSVTPGAWSYGSWADSTACVGSSKNQLRSASCLAGGVVVAESRCTAVKGATSQSVACTPTGVWIYSAWANDPSSACVVSGSSATRRQIRNASCIDGGTAAPDSQCVGAQQALSQSVACTPVGVWEYSAWTNAAGAVCTNAGSGGNGNVDQTRTATCKVAGVAAPGQCADPQQSLTQSGSCTPTGVLTYGPWVNNASGYGSSCTYDGTTSTRGQTRNPICTNGGQTVPINQCAEVPMTTILVGCTPDGTWNYTWVNSGACVASKQTQNATAAVCKIGGTQVADNLCGAKLTTQQIACTAAATQSVCGTLVANYGISGSYTSLKSGRIDNAPGGAQALCGAVGGNVTICSTYVLASNGVAYYEALTTSDAASNHITPYNTAGSAVSSIATGTCVPK